MTSKGEEKDVVCGKPVARKQELLSTYGDRPYYFCSKTCQETFVSDPLKYVALGGDAGSLEGTPKKN